MADKMVNARSVREAGADDSEDATVGLERSMYLVIVISPGVAFNGAEVNVSASIKPASANFAVFFMIPSLWGWAYRLGHCPVVDALKLWKPCTTLGKTRRRLDDRLQWITRCGVKKGANHFMNLEK
jgi:hypothetical protein